MSQVRPCCLFRVGMHCGHLPTTARRVTAFCSVGHDLLVSLTHSGPVLLRLTPTLTVRVEEPGPALTAPFYGSDACADGETKVLCAPARPFICQSVSISPGPQGCIPSGPGSSTFWDRGGDVLCQHHPGGSHRWLLSP